MLGIWGGVFEEGNDGERWTDEERGVDVGVTCDAVSGGVRLGTCVVGKKRDTLWAETLWGSSRGRLRDWEDVGMMFRLCSNNI